MNTKVDCTRDECTRTFTVDDDQDSARCPSCGKKHSSPWTGNDSSADSTATTEPASTEIEAPAGATIRITIEVEPR